MADWSDAIANAFIRRALEAGKPLDQMQLQKLVYIAHGFSLSRHGQPLTWDNPEAWSYGPVYARLNTALRFYGTEPVDRPIRNREDREIIAVLTETERRLVDGVYRDLGTFPAFKLSAVTHDATSPWAKIYANGLGSLKEIPRELIRDYFVGLEVSDAA